MIFTQTKRAAAAKSSARKLHSIHALLRERAFVGVIEAGALKYDLTYTPTAAAVKDHKLVLTGSIIVKTPTGKTATVNNVTATLAAAQGSISTSASKPRAFQLVTPSPFAADPQGQPLTDLTDARSALGVLYFHLSALDGRALGVPFDLGKVQLNGRLALIDQTARDLQWLFTQAHAALMGEKPDEQMAEPYVTELNRVLSA